MSTNCFLKTSFFAALCLFNLIIIPSITESRNPVLQSPVYESPDSTNQNAPLIIHFYENPQINGKVDRIEFSKGTQSLLTFDVNKENPFLDHYEIESADPSGRGYWLKFDPDAPNLIDVEKISTSARVVQKENVVEVIYKLTYLGQDLEALSCNTITLRLDQSGKSVKIRNSFYGN